MSPIAADRALRARAKISIAIKMWLGGLIEICAVREMWRRLLIGEMAALRPAYGIIYINKRKASSA